MTDHLVTSQQALAQLYPPPQQRAWAKESDVVTPLYAELLATAPFCTVATIGEDGIDCSPRGDAPGFITVEDEHTLLIPDRRGNNRLDTLKNLLQHNNIGLLFLIPGVGEAIRVRGTAAISSDPQLLARFPVRGVLPATVIVVTVSKIYFQCQRAILRSKLWDPASRVDRASLPSTGCLQVEAGAMSADTAADYDATLADYAAATLYAGLSKP
ncbi:MAG: pyridoxamine 5'-phosphate oxidase family protein [Actinomycetota bacterium]|nr:pyridoxamine 5'-phosphate oxidase family protein [Actinomycetota bacterium]